MGISTHVLDTALGRPAEGIPATLDCRSEVGEWSLVGRGTTNSDGRIADLLSSSDLKPAHYRVTFALESYLGADGFFPQATIHFRVRDVEQHYHVPLLLSPFGYSTYRGS